VPASAVSAGEADASMDTGTAETNNEECALMIRPDSNFRRGPSMSVTRSVNRTSFHPSEVPSIRVKLYPVPISNMSFPPSVKVTQEAPVSRLESRNARSRVSMAQTPAWAPVASNRLPTVRVNSADGQASVFPAGTLDSSVRSASAAEEKGMLDDKSKRGQADRSRASASKPYEVAYFAKKHGISSEDAKRIIMRHGPDRNVADKAASRLK